MNITKRIVCFIALFSFIFTFSLIPTPAFAETVSEKNCEEEFKDIKNIEEDKKEAISYIKNAEELLKKGALESAEESLVNSIKMQPTAYAYFYLGAIHASKKNFAEAEKDFLSSLELAKKDSNTDYETGITIVLSALYYHNGEYKKAKRSLEHLQEIAPGLTGGQMRELLKEVEKKIKEKNIDT